MTGQLPAGCDLRDFRVRGDERGQLIALEEGSSVPFTIKRVYYIYATKTGEARGFHAHHDLQQIAICVSGACTMTLDDGRTRVDVRLDRPNLGVQIGSLIWREMSDFTPDCVLVVLASRLYDEADYIRDYSAFCDAIAAVSRDSEQ
jgi:dTDP-4-dehydrorhamnose 3,5-epimerase-like enzyme